MFSARVVVVGSTPRAALSCATALPPSALNGMPAIAVPSAAETVSCVPLISMRVAGADSSSLATATVGVGLGVGAVEGADVGVAPPIGTPGPQAVRPATPKRTTASTGRR